jgi:hypothetical protein
MPYVAIVLDDQEAASDAASRKGSYIQDFSIDPPFRRRMLSIVPEGWRPICHHITLAMGRPKEGSELAKAIGRHVEGIRTGRVLGDDQVIAVEVELPEEIRALCTNRVPHVTIAVNPATGGKPVMSNFLPWSAAGGGGPLNDLTISGTILVVN